MFLLSQLFLKFLTFRGCKILNVVYSYMDIPNDC